MSTETLDSTQAADQAGRIVGELAKEADGPLEVEMAPDRTRELGPLKLSRMRTDYRPGDEAEVMGVINLADGIIHRTFPDAFLLLNDLYSLVRKPVVDESTGEISTDVYGWPEWQRLPSGAYDEDYSRLTNREKEDLLLRITTLLVEWGQQYARLRGTAQLMRVRWEEAMATGFIAPTGRATVEERTQRGRAFAVEDRYRAVFRSAVQQQAEQLIRSLELLGQRLKDSLTA